MISTFFLNVLYIVVFLATLPVRALPNVTLTPAVSNAISLASYYLSLFSAMFPVSDFITVFLLVLAIDAGIFVFKGVNWIIRKIPTIN